MSGKEDAFSVSMNTRGATREGGDWRSARDSWDRRHGEEHRQRQPRFLLAPGTLACQKTFSEWGKSETSLIVVNLDWKMTRQRLHHPDRI